MILLGRLGLDTGTARRLFTEVSERTFGAKKWLSRDSVYSATALEKVMGEIVARHCGRADAKMLDTSSDVTGCKVSVDQLTVRHLNDSDLCRF